ncbi:MAG: tyrosine-type recombinase/integrase [Aquabacterium sp.]|nr:tyrosine-type recombinase/integrase [Aquabacterium sp.]
MKSEKRKLTEAVVAKFTCPPDERQAFMWDTEVQGLGVRALPAHVKDGKTRPGAKTWIVAGRVAGTGQERRIALGRVDVLPLLGRNDAGDDEVDHGARERARRIRRLMALGRDPLAEEAQARAQAAADAEQDVARSVTLRDVTDHYIANKKTRNGALKANTVRDINEVVDKVFAAWTDKPIAAITRSMCEARHAELVRGGLHGDRPAPTTARGAFVVLRALINWAMEKYRVNDEPLIRENPVRVLKGQMAPPKVRTTKAPMNRVGHVWEALQSVRRSPARLPATHTQADALAFMLLTGARKEEVLGLTWDRVELGEDAGAWHLPTPKNGNPVWLPLSAPARALLKARPRRKGCEWVFPSATGKKPIGTPRGPAMVAAVEAAGCHIDRHALRRTFTTLAVTVLGIELWKVRLLTNHISTGGDVTLDHYTERNDLRYLAPEAERIGAWIIEQGNIAAGRNVVKLPDRRRA